MPSVFGKEAKKKELLNGLDNIYSQIQREHQLAPGDFPDIEHMREKLKDKDFSKFRVLDRRLLDRVDKMLADDISKLLLMIPNEEKARVDESKVEGGAFDTTMKAGKILSVHNPDLINSFVTMVTIPVSEK